MQGGGGNGAGTSRWVAGTPCDVSGVGGIRFTAGVEGAGTGGRGGGTVVGGGGGDIASDDSCRGVTASGAAGWLVAGCVGGEAGRSGACGLGGECGGEGADAGGAGAMEGGCGAAG